MVFGPTTNYSGIGGNDEEKFIHYQVLVNTFVLKLK